MHVHRYIYGNVTYNGYMVCKKFIKWYFSLYIYCIFMLSRVAFLFIYLVGWLIRVGQLLAHVKLALFGICDGNFASFM